MTKSNKQLFESFTFKKGVRVNNRIAMAPMTTWSSNDDYTVSDQEIQHYNARVKGPALVITGCSRVTANGIGFTHEFASYDDSFLPSLTKLAASIKNQGALAILQIYHAGNKTVSELVPGGEVVSASSVEIGPTAFVSAHVIPRELTPAEISNMINAFGDATKRAIDAGFDGVELHGAHGFLLQNFFSPLYNQRKDDWGGSAEKRMRFPLEVVKEVQDVIEKYANRAFFLGYRISPEEPQPGGYKFKDIYPLIDELIRLEVDYVHLSLSNVLDSKPTGKTEGKSIVELILDKVAGRVPVLAAGGLKKPSDASEALKLGLTMVAIGQALVINPNWVELAKAGSKVNETLSVAKLPDLAIPEKLWTVIDSAKGWFPVTA